MATTIVSSSGKAVRLTSINELTATAVGTAMSLVEIAEAGRAMEQLLAAVSATDGEDAAPLQHRSLFTLGESGDRVFIVEAG